MNKTEHFKTAMSRLAGGVTLITTMDAGGQPHGLAVTSFVSITAEPGQVLFSINRAASAYEPLVKAGFFCANFLGAGHLAVSNLFGSSKNREARFSEGQWAPLQTGAPALEGALANVDCVIDQSFEMSSHTIVVGAVVDIRLAEQVDAPLVYFNRGYLT